MTEEKVSSPPPKPKGRSKDQGKREAILEAAVTCMIDAGFDNTSMDDIASKASVSKQTVYSHFQNKENLFSQAVTMVGARLLPFDLVDNPESIGMNKALTLIGKNFVQLVLGEESYNVLKMISADSSSSHRLAELFFEAGPKMCCQKVKNLLNHWTQKGKLEIKDADLAVWQFLSLLKGRPFFMRGIGLGGELEEEDLDQHVAQSIEAFLKIYGCK